MPSASPKFSEPTEPTGVSRRVLVVGTTPDYVDWLRLDHPGECLFLTETHLRREATEPPPAEEEEVLFGRDDPTYAADLLVRHLERFSITVEGIACFDCESMLLAARLGRQLGLPYPSIGAIRCCRDKYLMKERWQQAGVPCPRFCLVDGPERAADFSRRLDAPCVLKPLSGAGSELVFRADGASACAAAAEQILSELRLRSGAALYRDTASPRTSVLIEEFIDGTEMSCDFLLENGTATVLRLTRKYPHPRAPFGTIRAYELIADRSAAGVPEQLEARLREAATALGIERAVCMVDFIVRGGEVYFLEMAPRCGGDYLPFLLKAACGYDMLGRMLQFARGPIGDAVVRVERPVVGLRLFADREGRIEQLDAAALRTDSRVLAVRWLRQAGETVTLPPRDYDSWILGQVIYYPGAEEKIASQNERLASLARISIVP